MGRTRFPNLRAYVDHRLSTEPQLTQERIAADLGVSPSSLSLYLSGHRTPRLDTAARIADVSGVPVAALAQPLSIKGVYPTGGDRRTTAADRRRSAGRRLTNGHLGLNRRTGDDRRRSDDRRNDGGGL